VTPPRRRLRITLAYDGTDYAGWQLQPGAPTLQEELERGLARLQGAPVRVHAAGRTDAGAHACGQVAHCDLASRLDDAALLRALRAVLPPALRPLALSTVDPGFDSRRHVALKTYRYTLDRSAAGDPFLARYALAWPHRLEHEPLDVALRRLPGRRDWSGFTASKCEKLDRVRELVEARYEEPDATRGWFWFSADGFLTHMVRNLVGTLLEIASGRVPPERIDEILERGERTLAGPAAAARGLCLWRVVYGGETSPAGETGER